MHTTRSLSTIDPLEIEGLFNLYDECYLKNSSFVALPSQDAQSRWQFFNIQVDKNLHLHQMYYLTTSTNKLVKSWSGAKIMPQKLLAS